ncbi:MAG: hypothetical protein MUP85_13225 [Candidatus Lokiarchaeota archaeon]|nr:hypothetical protein [Candidatus Lokiarchaeota archaeon]
MAIIKETIQAQMNDLNEYSPITFICPVCKTRKELKIPKVIINEARQLTTVSIPKGLVCEHHFQAFVDKNFVIRGYQKVDFEIAYDIYNKKKKKKPEITQPENFYDEIIIEGNYIEFRPNKAQKDKEIAEKKKIKKNLIIKEEILSNPNKKKNDSPPTIKEKHVMSIEEIYDEFWEFIDNENEDFKQFIEIDNRRK